MKWYRDEAVQQKALHHNGRWLEIHAFAYYDNPWYIKVTLHVGQCRLTFGRDKIAEGDRRQRQPWKDLA